MSRSDRDDDSAVTIRERLSGRRAKELAEDLNAALRHMEQAVAECYVDGPTSQLHPESKTRGWGVWVTKPRINHDPDPASEAPARGGQHGLLGTAAGLELMSSSVYFRDDIADGKRGLLLEGAWLYVRDRVEVPRALQGHDKPQPEPATQKQGADAEAPRHDDRHTLLIRQTQMLRALAALHRHLFQIAPEDRRWLTAGANAELAKHILEELTLCRQDGIVLKNLPGQCASAITYEGVPGYRFTSRLDSGAPETPNEWAYLLGSVVVAVGRCCESGLLQPGQLEKYVTQIDVTNLTEWTKAAVRSDNPDAVRVGLYAGWCLLQLDGLFERGLRPPPVGLHTGADAGIHDPSVHNIGLRLPSAKRRALSKTLRGAATKVIKNHTLRPDLHHPYSFHTPVEDGATGDPWRQDHLVVPTVPIAVWLKAHLDEKALYDKRFERFIRQIADCFQSSSEPLVVPGQSSTYNGTVNMNYIHEAIAEAARRSDAMSEQPFSWRAAAVVTRPRPTLSKVTASPSTALMLAVILLLLSPFIAWLYESWGFGPDSETTQIVAPNPLRTKGTRVESLKPGQTLTIRAGSPALPPANASDADRRSKPATAADGRPRTE